MDDIAFLTLAEPVPATQFEQTTDAEFLQQIPWEKDADADLVKFAKAGDLKAFWESLVRNTFGIGPRAARKKVQERRCATGMSLWSRRSFEETPRETLLADVWSVIADRLDDARQSALSHQAKKKRTASNGKHAAADSLKIKIPRKQMAALTAWCESANEQAPSAWELLILTELLRLAGGSLPAKVGIPLWRQTLLAAANWGTQAETADDSREVDVIRTAELPWVLGVLFADVKGSETLREQGEKALGEHLDQHTDTDGTLRADVMERAVSWLPPLVRAAEWGYAAERSLWKDIGEERFQYLITRIVGCYAGDGHLAFDSARAEHVFPMLMSAARLAGSSKKEWPLKFLLDVAEARPELLPAGGSRKQSAKLKSSRRRPVETDSNFLVQQSDWARMACLRNHAGRDADVFAITHHRPLPRIDFSILGQSIMQGSWEAEVTLDGTPLEMPAEWTCVCWHSDADGDYLELQYTIDENRRMERQVFLSRTEHFLVMADCLSGMGDAVIDYTARWPMHKNAQVARQDGSREQVVTRGDVQMRAFPLGLPDDIVQSTAGSWKHQKTKNASALELRQLGQGGIYAPVVFEWTPARQNSYAEWRTLTVTENGPKVKSDRASGHRLRIGNQQLLLYRSLLPTDELRTVLGHHTGHETIIARFNKTGDVKPLLIVE